MNHIIAALYVIGIAFAIWAGFANTAPLDTVEGLLGEVEAAVVALEGAQTDDEIAEGLEALREPLKTLVSSDTRLPRGLQSELERLSAVAEDVADAAIEQLADAQSAGLVALSLATRIDRDTSVNNRLRYHVEGVSTLAAEIPSRDIGEDEELQAALSSLRESWDASEPHRDVSPTQLTAASLSAQGNTLFIEFTDAADIAVKICIALIGIMALWLGLMRIAEEAGLIQMLAALIRPILRFLFPKVPKEHPAEGAVMMSLAANIMGLDNAATPLGLKAMKELQTLNSRKDTITDDQAMLLALNTSSVNLIPFTVIAYRVSEGSTMPNDIIIPTIIATSTSTLVAVILTKTMQRFSKDPAYAGAEAEAIRDEIVAKIHAAAHGENNEEEAKS